MFISDPLLVIMAEFYNCNHLSTRYFFSDRLYLKLILYGNTHILAKTVLRSSDWVTGCLQPNFFLLLPDGHVKLRVQINLTLPTNIIPSNHIKVKVKTVVAICIGASSL